MKRSAVFIALLIAAAPAYARDSLGVFERWGAFRDANPVRCFAVAEPERHATDLPWRPFVSVSHWPQRKIRGQLHVRLSRERTAEAPVTLTIGDRRFPLVSGDADAWAPDSRTDLVIVTAMRSAPSMSISSRDVRGRAFRDSYRLRGAATAIDAAALGCARLR